MRWILAIAFAAAVSFVVPASFDTAVAKKHFKNKLCMGTNLAGAKVNFKCKISEKCCFDAVVGTGSCVGATGICL
jgi:hypothetical protein